MLCCYCHFDCFFGTDKAVSVADRLRVQLCLHGQALKAQSCLFHDSALFTVAHGLLLYLKLAVKKDFLLFVLYHEAGLADRAAIVALLVVLLLVTLFICSFGVRFAQSITIAQTNMGAPKKKENQPCQGLLRS